MTHAANYRGIGPVRVGNQAQAHFQPDVYGSVVLGAAQAFHDHRLQRRGDTADFHALEVMGEQAWALHDQPDTGSRRPRWRNGTCAASTCVGSSVPSHRAGVEIPFLQPMLHRPARRPAAGPGVVPALGPASAMPGLPLPHQ